MSNEEKKTIDELKEEINKPLEVPEDKFDTFILYNIESAKNILNLIEKQSKEIEELKEKNKILEAISLSFNEIQDRDKKWKYKIKAKIEEIDEVLKGQLIEKIRVYFEAQKEVLQSLLEKE